MRRPKALAPTLWRTCRVLMNEERLRLFKTVIEHPDEMNVSQIARCLEIPQPHATNGLRALQARGLLGVRRERFSVFYNLTADRSLPEAISLQHAFIDLFNSPNLESDWIGRMMVVLKAFTHFNRLAMIRRLALGPATKRDLEKASGVVVKSLGHHLRYLRLAGLLESRGDAGTESTYALCEPTNPIAKELVRQVLCGSQDYFNNAKGTEENLRLLGSSSGAMWAEVCGIGERRKKSVFIQRGECGK